ncbi:MAG: outer membrane protein transport protein [Robiginitomaculum sp.]|nr:outer membrane protein transport protein [Robiginitomaculum sp.]MDQ7077244.1 outer membrane protein transport protein [Robiginitomaculum sp.]
MARITGKLLTSAAMGAIALSMIGVPAAQATEGYFQHGISARSKAMGGAGVADSRDAFASALNPAGAVDVEDMLQINLSAFSPNRHFTGSGPGGFTPAGDVKSGSNLFPVPGFAYSRKLSDNFGFALTAVGNGGMNTSWPRDLANPVCGSGPFPAPTGVFCGAGTGVNLNQLLIAASFAYKFADRLSIGFAPVLAINQFEARGLAAFGGVTSNPAALTNNESEFATGLGGRFGAQLDVTDQFRIAATYQSELNMSRFKKYAGLFADQGDFNIPENYTLGVAFDATPDFTIAIDYKRINYSAVGSIGNSSRTPRPFGSFGGPGFGWSNVDVIKFGAEWRQNDQWTWRAGFAKNDNPIGPDDVTLNIMAPGVMKTHLTGGFEYNPSQKHSFEFAFMYAPTTRVSGIEVTPAGPNPNRIIELRMKQWEATIGWKMKFGK